MTKKVQIFISVEKPLCHSYVFLSCFYINNNTDSEIKDCLKTSSSYDSNAMQQQTRPLVAMQFALRINTLIGNHSHNTLRVKICISELKG